MKRHLLAGLFVGIIGILYAVGIWWGIKESNECDEHIILIDGSEYDCTSVNSCKDGTTHFRPCGKKLIIVPTSRVKEISYKP